MTCNKVHEFSTSSTPEVFFEAGEGGQLYRALQMGTLPKSHEKNLRKFSLR
jgi:hypothetical protein